jgi:hypothetical protein
MRLRLVWWLALGLVQLSCGLPPRAGEVDLEQPAPEALSPPPVSAWPDAPDLGVIVSSQVVPLSDPPPPPDFEH